MTLNDQLTNQNRIKMEQKTAYEKLFVEKCAEFAKEIERYSGTDQLDPWYRYLVWLEENYVIDFSAESIFMDILCRCLATFEADERYKQDRRMIKLFIKYISYRKEPEEHFNLMYSNGIGTRVSDLYACWAHWFNIAGNFDRAEEIYQWGFKAKARSSRLLESAHQAFGVNMSKRILNKSDPKYEAKARLKLHEKYIEFIALNLEPKSTKSEAKRTRINLQEFDQPEAYAIPFLRMKSVQPATPERQSTTSLIQTIVNSCSARKKPLGSRHSLHQKAVSRLNFCSQEYPPISMTDANDMYSRGIQLPKNFARTNLPQNPRTVPPVRDDDLNESDVLTLPMYDKIMLLPAIDKSYSPEELKAYKWYKEKSIVNNFTAEMDAVWSVGWNVPFRRGEWLVKRNLPQQEEVQQTDYFIDGPIAEGIWQFAFNIEQLYPNGKEEFSREELLRQKRNKSMRVGDRRPSSILRTISRQKLKLHQPLTSAFESSPRPSSSQQNTKHIECQPMNVNAESKSFDFSQNMLQRKTNRSEMLDDGLPDVKKNRPTSFEFKELNDMCTTQTFGMFLDSHAVSTPNPTMGVNRRSTNANLSIFVATSGAIEDNSNPSLSTKSAIDLVPDTPESNMKFDIFTDESMAHANANSAHIANSAPMVSQMDEKAAAGKMKFETFADESIAHVTGKREGAAFEFEIYRDETKVMSEVIRHNAEKQLTQPTTSLPINDENRPIECLPTSVPCKSIRSTVNSTEPPLKESNGTMEAMEKQQQIACHIDHSFAMTDFEKDLISRNSKKVNFSYDFEDLNKPKLIVRQPSIDTEDSEENDSLGKSIYVPREEVIFSDAKHADWAEVTLHLAEGDAVKNDYVAEPVDMNQTLQLIDEQLLDLMKLSPFNPKLQKALLDSVLFVNRLSKMDKNVCDMVKIVQPMKPKSKLTMGNRKFTIQKMIGYGNFGNVFYGECCRTKALLAFKQQRPPNMWEYYICLEVQKRLENQRIRNGCMSIDYALIGNNATIFASKFSPFGTLLNVCNKVKTVTGRNVDEYVVMIFAKQMFTIIDALHRVNIIHGDVKPDNFLLMNPLDENYDAVDLAIQLIDFGQSIDMKLFPKNQMFYSKLKTKNFVCTEMMDNRPWTFQTDLFCVASTIYTIVFGEYMVVRKANKNSSSYTTRSIPRYYNKKLWTYLFDVLINIPDLQRLPNLGALCQLLDDEINAVGVKAMSQKIIEFNKALVK